MKKIERIDRIITSVPSQSHSCISEPSLIELANKINEIIDVLNGEDEGKEEADKGKSQRGVFTKEELQFLKCVLNDKETVRYYSNGGDGYWGEHIEPILEKIDKLSSEDNETGRMGRE